MDCPERAVRHASASPRERFARQIAELLTRNGAMPTLRLILRSNQGVAA